MSEWEYTKWESDSQFRSPEEKEDGIEISTTSSSRSIIRMNSCPCVRRTGKVRRRVNVESRS